MKKEKKDKRRGGRFEMTPSIPVIPEPVQTLPSWMYGDPAAVVERIEERAIVAQERRATRELQAHRQRYGLVSEATVRLIKRARIRALVDGVLGRKR
jgi:hypothetical protein